MKRGSSSPLDVSQSVDFHCDDIEDILNLAGKLVEDSNDRLGFHNVNFLERYIKGELFIVSSFFARSNGTNYDLVFAAVPPTRGESPAIEVSSGNAISPTDRANSDEHFILLHVAYPVETSEKVVPSFVWLERTKERLDIIRKIFEHDHVLKVRHTDGERESRFSLSSLSESLADASELVVKRQSVITNNISGGVRQMLNGRFDEPDFLQFIYSSRVLLTESGIWLRLEEIPNPFFKLPRLFLTPSKREP